MQPQLNIFFISSNKTYIYGEYKVKFVGVNSYQFSYIGEWNGVQSSRKKPGVGKLYNWQVIQLKIQEGSYTIENPGG